MSDRDIITQINIFVELTQREEDFLNSQLISRPFKRGELLAEAGEPSRYIIYIAHGFTMTYVGNSKGIHHVVQFGCTGWWTGDIYNLNENRQTLFTTETLSDGKAFLLPSSAHENLLNNYQNFERYFRKIFQKTLLRKQFQFLESHTLKAKERYVEFVKTYPGIDQYAPQKHIASFLGITPEFLSRIKSQIAKEHY